MKNKYYLLLLLPLIISGCSKKDNSLSIHTNVQRDYLNSSNKEMVLSFVDGKKENSRPSPIKLKDDNVFGNTIFTIYLDEACTQEYKTIESSTNECDVYNLYFETYYYKVTTSTYTSETKSLTISDTKWRCLYIDGITNVRDIGYLSTEDGGYVKPGMIYRSSSPAASNSLDCLITDLGKRQVKEDMKLKSEIDLRTVENGETANLSESYFGEGVTYYSLPMKSGGNYLKINNDCYDGIFEVLANKEIYPVDLHCAIGTDRTGAICFLMEALLGVTEEDLILDYLLSNFGNIGGVRTSSQIKDYIKTIKNCSGNSLKEKAYNYLKGTCNVNTEYLDKFIENMNA